MLLRLNAMWNTVFVTPNPDFGEDDVLVDILPRDFLLSVSTEDLHDEVPRRETSYTLNITSDFCKIGKTPHSFARSL
jgi:hypothetical protein